MRNYLSQSMVKNDQVAFLTKYSAMRTLSCSVDLQPLYFSDLWTMYCQKQAPDCGDQPSSAILFSRHPASSGCGPLDCFLKPQVLPTASPFNYKGNMQIATQRVQMAKITVTSQLNWRKDFEHVRSKVESRLLLQIQLQIIMQEPTSTQFSEAEESKPAPAAPVQPAGSKINKNFMERTRTTILMLLGFGLILAAGQIYTSLFIIFLNFMVFKEINSLKRNEEKQINIPLTKYINWYAYVCVTYYALGVLILAKFPILGLWYQPVNFLLTYHHAICCMLAVGLLVSFVVSLKQGYLKYQFRLFGWIIMAMFLAIYQSWYLIHSIFEGMFFYIVPSLLIIVNDIFAYLFGYFFGKRQLIALSPKKTWEGYIGGAISTFFFTFVLTSALSQIPGITCPMIEPTLMPFTLPQCQEPLLELTNLGFLPFSISYLSLHVMVIGLFASIIGPFGGFFASGLKRSIKIKDFANLIPGHGGVTDRLDCQVIIGTFTYFYLHSFMRASTNTVFYWVNSMRMEEKIALYQALVASFHRQGIQPSSLKLGS